MSSRPHVILAAGASAALHKSCELASRLTQDGYRVRCLLTERAAELVDPQLFEALTGEAAQSSEFGPGRQGAMDHIALAEWAQAMVVAPATGHLIARLALGLADDLVTTVSLALPAGVPRLLCPAMNSHMLAAAPIARHLVTLREDGWQAMETVEGHLACGIEGAGRLAEPPAIAAALARVLPVEA